MAVLLKAIDLKEIIEKYHKNFYEKVRPPETKIEFLKKKKDTSLKIGENANDNIYSFRDKNNTVITIVTTGNKDWEDYNFKGKREFTGGRCEWCRREMKQKKGLPFKIEQFQNEYKIYMTDEYFCGFRCMFSGIKYIYAPMVRIQRNHLYADIETFILFWFDLEHPGEKLVEAMDWKLLDIYGGPLSDDQYDNIRYRAERTGNIIINPIPTKTEYRLSKSD
jgi:hypothetical protein